MRLIGTKHKGQPIQKLKGEKLMLKKLNARDRRNMYRYKISSFNKESVRLEFYFQKAQSITGKFVYIIVNYYK